VALIQTRSLTKRYPGVTALDALTVDVEPGIVGLVGANGAGKSTLIKILLGLLDASGGSVRVLGIDPASDGEAVRARVGYMPEHGSLSLSLLTRRPVLLGLLYLLIWEGLLGNLLAGSLLLSIQQYMLTVAAEATPSDLLHERVSLPVAAVMAAVFLVGGTLLAVDRLRSFKLAGETS